MRQLGGLKANTTAILIRRRNLDTQRDTRHVHVQRKEHVRMEQGGGDLQATRVYSGDQFC